MNEDDSEEGFCHFGTALEIDDDEDEDLFKKRKLPSDFRERVLDEKGRPLRFHGAFTGGFSAGHFNTVGSQEGFTPSSFYSSRKRNSEKNSNYTKHKPEDYMDEGDFSDFGIAPRNVRVANKFDSSEFSNAVKKSLGSIGTISSSYNDPLKDLIAPKIATISQRLIKRMFRFENNAESQSDQIAVTSPAVNYTKLDFNTIQKENTFGLGYKPLTSDLQKTNNSQSSHLYRSSASSFVDSLFPEYKSIGRGIRGAGFGVGIQEEQDDDIYYNDDLSNYDFSIAPDTIDNQTASGEELIRSSSSSHASSKSKSVLSNFKVGSTVPAKKYPLPYLPRDFNPKFKKTTKTVNAKKPVVIDDKPRTREIVVRPKASDEISKNTTTEWEKPLEKKPPLSSLSSWSGHLAMKFQSAGVDEPIGSSSSTEKKCLDQPKTLSERDLAVKVQNYGVLTRSVQEWRPDNILCKRFNVPNPFPDSNFTGVPTDKKSEPTQFLLYNPASFTSSMPSRVIDVENPSIISETIHQSKPPPSDVDNNSASNSEQSSSGIQKSATVSIRPPSKGNIFSVLFDNNNSDKLTKNNNTSTSSEILDNKQTATSNTNSLADEPNIEKNNLSTTSIGANQQPASPPPVVGIPTRPIDLFKSIFASDEDSDFSDSDDDDVDNNNGRKVEEEILSKISETRAAAADEKSVPIVENNTPSVDSTINESVNRILSAVTNLMGKSSTANLQQLPDPTKDDSSSDLEFVEVTKSTLLQSSKKSKSSKHKKSKKHKKKGKKKKKRHSNSSDSDN